MSPSNNFQSENDLQIESLEDRINLSFSTNFADGVLFIDQTVDDGAATVDIVVSDQGAFEILVTEGAQTSRDIISVVPRLTRLRFLESSTDTHTFRGRNLIFPTAIDVDLQNASVIADFDQYQFRERLRFLGGDGNNSISFRGEFQAQDIAANLGGGDDSIIVNSGTANRFDINLGDGNDTFRSRVGGVLNLRTGAGDDNVDIDSSLIPLTMSNISTGSGNDRLDFFIFNSATERINVDLGSGDDIFLFDEEGGGQGVLDVDFGTGNDRFETFDLREFDARLKRLDNNFDFVFDASNRSLFVDEVRPGASKVTLDDLGESAESDNGLFRMTNAGRTVKINVAERIKVRMLDNSQTQLNVALATQLQDDLHINFGDGARTSVVTSSFANGPAILGNFKTFAGSGSQQLQFGSTNSNSEKFVVNGMAGFIFGADDDRLILGNAGSNANIRADFGQDEGTFFNAFARTFSSDLSLLNLTGGFDAFYSQASNQLNLFQNAGTNPSRVQVDDSSSLGRKEIRLVVDGKVNQFGSPNELNLRMRNNSRADVAVKFDKNQNALDQFSIDLANGSRDLNFIGQSPLVAQNLVIQGGAGDQAVQLAGNRRLMTGTLDVNLGASNNSLGFRNGLMIQGDATLTSVGSFNNNVPVAIEGSLTIDNSETTGPNRFDVDSGFRVLGDFTYMGSESIDDVFLNSNIFIAGNATIDLGGGNPAGAPGLNIQDFDFDNGVIRGNLNVMEGVSQNGAKVKVGSNAVVRGNINFNENTFEIVSILGRVLGGQRLGTGDVQVTLRWDTLDDLDLAVLDPEGDQVSFRNRLVASGGMLDVDANAGSGDTSMPVENIFWPRNGAPVGSYVASVNLFSQRQDIGEPINFTLTITLNGQSRTFRGSVSLSERTIEFPFSFQRGQGA